MLSLKVRHRPNSAIPLHSVSYEIFSFEVCFVFVETASSVQVQNANGKFNRLPGFGSERAIVACAWRFLEAASV
jgi:hypothetical protein